MFISGVLIFFLMISKQFNIKQHSRTLNKKFNLNNTFNIINLTLKINNKCL